MTGLVRVLFALLFLQPACFASRILFSSEVWHGQAYQHRIAPSLWFCLFPEPDANGGGWRIAVQQECSLSSHDFAAVATPPIHGVNAREIEGWHFDTGANAPQRVREFSFVLDDRGYQRLMSDLNSCRDAAKCLPK
jgi:hypothetical protein